MLKGIHTLEGTEQWGVGEFSLSLSHFSKMLLWKGLLLMCVCQETDRWTAGELVSPREIDGEADPGLIHPWCSLPFEVKGFKPVMNDSQRETAVERNRRGGRGLCFPVVEGRTILFSKRSVLCDWWDCCIPGMLQSPSSSPVWMSAQLFFVLYCEP